MTAEVQSGKVREAGWREWQWGGVQAVILLIALCGLFPGYFFRGEMIAPTIALRDVQPWLSAAGGTPAGIPMRLMPDVITFFIPQYSLIQRALNQDEWPLWNPYQFGGMPLMANCQSSVLLPPRILLLFFSLQTAVSLFILLKLWLCGMAAWLAARRLGLGLAVASLYSLMWMTTPYCLLWSYWSLTDVALAFPVTFLGVEQCLRYSRSLSGPAFFGAGVAWMMLAGHPETAFAFCWVLGVYIGIRLLWNAAAGMAVLRPVWQLGIASVVVLGITAVQWLPFLEYLLHSSTFFERQTHERFYYPLTSLVCVAFPRFLGTFAEKNYWGNINSHIEMMLGTGAVTLAALPLAGHRLIARLRDRAPEAMMVVGLMTGALVAMTAGLDAGAMVWLNRLPFFRSMLWCYHTVFMVFALPLLAAIGLDRLFSGHVSLKYLGVSLIWCGLWVGLALGFYRYHLPLLQMAGSAAYVRREVMTGAGWLTVAVVLVGVGIAICRMTVRRRWLLGTFLAVTDLLMVLQAARALRMELPTSPKQWFYPETELIRTLKSIEQPVRIGLSEGGVVAGVLTPAGIMDWVGYDGLYPGRMWRFQRALGPEFWDAMEPAASIAYYLNDPRYPPIMPEKAYARMERLAELEGLELLRNPRALPWARLVFQLEEEPDPERQYIRMKTPGFDPEHVALVERLPETWAGGTVSSDPGSGYARVLQYTMNAVTVAVECDRPALLVTADAFFPGWKARVDGSPAPVVPAYTVFRSVLLYPGKHRVEFYYAPASFRAGVLITGTVSGGLSVLGVWILARRIKKNRYLVD